MVDPTRRHLWVVDVRASFSLERSAGLFVWLDRAPARGLSDLGEVGEMDSRPIQFPEQNGFVASFFGRTHPDCNLRTLQIGFRPYTRIQPGD